MSILLNSPQQIFFILQICTAIYSFKSDSRELFLNLTFSPFIYNSLSNPFDSTHTYSQISLYSCHPSPVIIYHLILLFPICSSHRNQKNSLRTQKNLIITSPCLITSQVTNPQPSLPAYAKSDPPALVPHFTLLSEFLLQSQLLFLPIVAPWHRFFLGHSYFFLSLFAWIISPILSNSF